MAQVRTSDYLRPDCQIPGVGAEDFQPWRVAACPPARFARASRSGGKSPGFRTQDFLPSARTQHGQGYFQRPERPRSVRYGDRVPARRLAREGVRRGWIWQEPVERPEPALVLPGGASLVSIVLQIDVRRSAQRLPSCRVDETRPPCLIWFRDACACARPYFPFHSRRAPSRPGPLCAARRGSEHKTARDHARLGTTGLGGDAPCCHHARSPGTSCAPCHAERRRRTDKIAIMISGTRR